MKINSDELADYVKAVLYGINKGIAEPITVNEEEENFVLTSPVKFQLGITNSNEVGGEVKIYVAGLHGGKASEEDGRIEFEVSTQGTAMLELIEKGVGIWQKFTPEEKESLKKVFKELLEMYAIARKALPEGSA
jgi:hypothetical protein